MAGESPSTVTDTSENAHNVPSVTSTWRVKGCIVLNDTVTSDADAFSKMAAAQGPYVCEGGEQLMSNWCA